MDGIFLARCVYTLKIRGVQKWKNLVYYNQVIDRIRPITYRENIPTKANGGEQWYDALLGPVKSDHCILAYSCFCLEDNIVLE